MEDGTYADSKPWSEADNAVYMAYLWFTSWMEYFGCMISNGFNDSVCGW
jgi:hypothetical protein